MKLEWTTDTKYSDGVPKTAHASAGNIRINLNNTRSYGLKEIAQQELHMMLIGSDKLFVDGDKAFHGRDMSAKMTFERRFVKDPSLQSVDPWAKDCICRFAEQLEKSAQSMRDSCAW